MHHVGPIKNGILFLALAIQAGRENKRAIDGSFCSPLVLAILLSHAFASTDFGSGCRFCANYPQLDSAIGNMRLFGVVALAIGLGLGVSEHVPRKCKFLL